MSEEKGNAGYPQQPQNDNGQQSGSDGQPPPYGQSSVPPQPVYAQPGQPGQPMMTAGQPMMTAGQPMMTAGQPMMTAGGQPMMTAGQPMMMQPGQPIMMQPMAVNAYGQPMVMQNQFGQPVMMQGGLMVNLDPNSPANNEGPVKTKCTNCNEEITTKTEYIVGGCTWLWCIMIASTGLIIFCFLPFLMNCAKDVVHRCPNCKTEVGRYVRQQRGNVRVGAAGGGYRGRRRRRRR